MFGKASVKIGLIPMVAPIDLIFLDQWAENTW